MFFVFALAFIEILIVAFVVVALIYLVIKRINDKNNEDFEKRDN